jgi:hypothetical protein
MPKATYSTDLLSLMPKISKQNFSCSQESQYLPVEYFLCRAHHIDGKLNKMHHYWEKHGLFLSPQFSRNFVSSPERIINWKVFGSILGLHVYYCS